MKNGWISIHRRLTDHWLWKDKPFTKGQAWLDILLECNHDEVKVNIKNEIIVCQRGESLHSLDTWARRWGWDKSKVRRFVTLLISDSMVLLKPTHKTTHLKVLNYDTYQGNRITDETQMKRKRNADETQMTLNNKYNKDNKDNKKDLNTMWFEKFWSTYPERNGKKLEKKKAIEQFNIKVKNESDFDRIMKSVTNYSKANRIPKDAFRWLRDESYLEWDEPEIFNNDEFSKIMEKL